jgi:hypothetical protein
MGLLALTEAARARRGSVKCMAAVIVSWFCDYCLIELGEMSSWVEAKTGWLYISTSRIPTSEVSTLLRNLNIKLGG